MPKKILLNDPVLNEFVYDWIHLASYQDKQRLNPRQQKSIKTPKSAKRFAVNSTFDEKLDMLSKLRARYCVMIFPEGLFNYTKAKEIFSKYEDLSPKDKVKAILDEKVVVISDKNVVLTSQLMSNAAHSDNWLLNRDFYKVGHQVLDWEEPENTLTESTKETIEYCNTINKLMLNAILGAKALTINRVNNDIDINILMYLLSRRNSYVSKQVIDAYFKAYYKVATITSAVKRLSENYYIDKHPASKERLFSITGLGIEEVMQFIKKAMNQTINF